MTDASLVAFLAGKVPLLNGFPKERIEQLIQGSQIATFEPHEAIIEFGQQGRFLGVLLDGLAEICVTDNQGSKHCISEIGSGNVFGAVSLMTGERAPADVISVTRCKAMLIPQDLFATMVATHPPAIRFLSKLITEQAQKTALDSTQTSPHASGTSKSQDRDGLLLQNPEPHIILVLACHRYALKYDVFDTEKGGSIGGGNLDIPEQGSHSHAFSAMHQALSQILGPSRQVTLVVHRFMNGGERFTTPTIVTQEVLVELRNLSHLEPHYNPWNIIGLEVAPKVLGQAVHVAVFDSAFHHTLPSYAFLYGLPYSYYETKGIRRYGFHGLSHAYVSLKTAQFLKRPLNELEIISCHFGRFASMCAVDHGRSVDTTMGMTRNQGLMMATRCGDLDPAVLIHLMQTQEMDAGQLDQLLSFESGFKGLSGMSGDMLEIEQAAHHGRHQALLAYKTFCYQIRKTIGAYMAAMQGLDAIVFTGGIGNGSPGVRSLACQGLAYMGICLDEKKNQAATGLQEAQDISADDARVRVLVMPTDEERMAAREGLRALSNTHIAEIIKAQKQEPISVEISAHHVHLSQEHVHALFGPGHSLTPASELSQPGQYACKEQVNLIGPKGRVERVRVLGPTRKQTQVEIAMTEQFKLGIHPPIRQSGDLDNTPGIALEGPHGSVTLEYGVICALRHIHMAPQDALKFGLRDKYVVRVRIEGDRELVYGDVLVRVSPSYRLAMHIDTDEGNAANIKTGMKGYIEGIQSRG